MILNRVHFRASDASFQNSSHVQHTALTEQLRNLLENMDITEVDVLVYTETESLRQTVQLQALERPCLVVGVVWHPEMVCSMNFYLINAWDKLTHLNRQEKRLIELSALYMKGSEPLKLLTDVSLQRLGKELTEVLSTRLASMPTERGIERLGDDEAIELLLEIGHPGARSPESDTESTRRSSRVPPDHWARTSGSGTF